MSSIRCAFTAPTTCLAANYPDSGKTTPKATAVHHLGALKSKRWSYPLLREPTTQGNRR